MLNVENSVENVENSKNSFLRVFRAGKRGSGADVFDDVLHCFLQAAVVLDILFHHPDGVDDGGMVTAREFPADLLHAHAGDFAQDIDCLLYTSP